MVIGVIYIYLADCYLGSYLVLPIGGVTDLYDLTLVQCVGLRICSVGFASGYWSIFHKSCMPILLF